MAILSEGVPAEKFAEVGRLKVRLKEYGSANGDVILFLHGWGCSADTMAGLAAALGNNFRCVLPDFPGFGKTAAPDEAWDVTAYARFTFALKKELFGDRPVGVIAHSFGARVMLKLLSDPQYASHFNKVLITGGAGMKPRRSWRYYYRTALAKMLKAPFMLLPPGMREKGLARMRQTAAWKSLGSADYSQLNGVMREVFVKTVREYLEPCLPLIGHEVLLVWGENDDATPLYQAERMEAGLKNGVLIKIKSAGHYAFLDQPQQFAAISKAYFDSK
ncbi:Pimeloyl-ACP methyl ester carboxylesterase [Cyclonatronum proteinivorum]|uniref:Pimeloyl-ACP methyl ester carboxylesterase n=1 Tax=Cyclonatronum proteinivorum TaxID=1457365 RepID=A0A345UGN2_9BACT|nr:alpha/beta hydrolase [Cyclonatronum proteinivorum]AXI99633.1 Pimeloyl-ACP methyl ester carboxylesterase [Cyclonatronum proteinivorum]